MEYKNILKEFIFEKEHPFASCHASTLIVLSNGDILSAWFGGTGEGADDVAIWVLKCTNGIWSKPFKAADIEGIPHWNPVLYRRKDSSILLFYKVGHKIPKWQTMLTISEDEGSTWSDPKELVPGDVGGRGPVKNKPIILSDGTLLAPASLEGEFWDAFVDISYDDGFSWKKSEMVPIVHGNSAVNDIVEMNMPVPVESFKGKGIIQPTLWESKPGMVHMLLRSTEGFIYRSDSVDSGKAWCPAYKTCLPNNNSGIDMVKLENGNLALVYNPVSQNWGARTPLVVKLSNDNGITWEHEFVLENEPGEFSYPAIVGKGEDIYVTYTWNRYRIKFCRLTVSM